MKLFPLMNQKEGEKIISESVRRLTCIQKLRAELVNGCDVVSLLEPYRTGYGIGCRVGLCTKQAWYEIEVMRIGDSDRYRLRGFRTAWRKPTMLLYQGDDSDESFKTLRDRIFAVERNGELPKPGRKRSKVKTKIEEVTA